MNVETLQALIKSIPVSTECALPLNIEEILSNIGLCEK